MAAFLNRTPDFPLNTDQTWSICHETSQNSHTASRPAGGSTHRPGQSLRLPSYTRVYPLVAERAEGLWVTDPDGNEFLDFTSGIAVCATGHCHPRVVEAIKDQADRLLHMSGTDFYYTPQIILAEKLASLVPGGGHRKVFFGNSGAEAVEAAFKLARWNTRRELNIAFFGAFHGRTMGALSLTASKAIQKRNYSPLVPGITHILTLTATAVPRGCAILDATWPACDGSKTPFSVPPFLPTKLQPSLSNPYRGGDTSCLQPNSTANCSASPATTGSFL